MSATREPTAIDAPSTASETSGAYVGVGPEPTDPPLVPGSSRSASGLGDGKGQNGDIARHIVANCRDPATPHARSFVILPPFLLLMLAATLLFWVDEPSWNQNSRLALTHSIAERGTLNIDDWHAITGDKSYREGHFYCDKAPGVSLLALPVYAALVGVRAAVGLERPAIAVKHLDPLQKAPTLEERLPGDRLIYNPAYRSALWLSRAGVVMTSALMGACALYLLARWLTALQVTRPVPAALAQGESAAPRRSHREGNVEIDQTLAALSQADTSIRWIPAVVVLSWLLASPALAYSTALYGHQPCAAFLIIATALIFLPTEARTAWLPGADSRASALLAGTSLGLAVICEYPAAVPVVLLCAVSALRLHWRNSIWMVSAGLPWALLLAVYHWVAFGSPLKTGYDFVYLQEFAEGMAVNYGVAAPRADVVLELLFGRHRGLYVVSPIMLLASAGLVVAALSFWSAQPRSYRAARVRPSLPRPLGGSSACAVRDASLLLTLAALICTYYLALNSGYYMWNGGSALGPRHCLPMLPFLSLGLVGVAHAMPRAVISVAVISLALALVTTFVGPEMPQSGDPIWEHAVPLVLRATLSSNVEGVRTTLGSVLGLPGLWGLLPLLFGWYWAIRIDQAEGT